MNVASLFLTYLIIWWLVFFMLLPVGVKAEDRPIEGQASSAPQNPNIWKKAFACSLISALLLALYIMLVRHHILTIQMVTG